MNVTTWTTPTAFLLRGMFQKRCFSPEKYWFLWPELRSRCGVGQLKRCIFPSKNGDFCARTWTVQSAAKRYLSLGTWRFQILWQHFIVRNIVQSRDLFKCKVMSGSSRCSIHSCVLLLLGQLKEGKQARMPTSAVQLAKLWLCCSTP